jgi:hypothetical protein
MASSTSTKSIPPPANRVLRQVAFAAGRGYSDGEPLLRVIKYEPVAAPYRASELFDIALRQFPGRPADAGASLADL